MLLEYSRRNNFLGKYLSVALYIKCNECIALVSNNMGNKFL